MCKTNARYMINARSVLRHLDTNDLGAFGWDWYVVEINQGMTEDERKVFRRRLQKRSKTERQIWSKTGILFQTEAEAISALQDFYAEYKKNYGKRLA